MEASPLPGSFRASPYPSLASSAEANWLAHGPHESCALLPTITVRAFIRCWTNMPSADFCCEIKASYDALSHESATHNRSPEVSSTAFRTQPPNLQPAPLMDMGFAVIGQLARRRMPLIRFLYIGSHVCSTLLSDPPSPERPCASLSLHLHQVVKRTFTFELSNMLGTPSKKPRSFDRGFCLLNRAQRIRCALEFNWATSYSPTHLARAVPSGLKGLTSVFGMGTGGTPSLQSPKVV